MITRFERPRSLDLLSAFSLLAIFVWNARRGLAPDGWHADDAWVVTVVSKSDSFTELINLGFTHPGFNVALRMITQGADDALAFQTIPFLAGGASLIALFHVLKPVLKSAVGAWAFLLPFASSWLLFRYSVAIKPYTIEVLGFSVALLATQRLRTATNRQLVSWLVALGPIVFIDVRLSFISMVTAFGLYWGRKVTIKQFAILTAGHAVIVGPILLFLRSRINADRLEQWWQDRPGTFTSDGESALAASWNQLHRATRIIFDGPSWMNWLLVGFVIAGAIVGVSRRDATATTATSGLVLAMLLSALALSPFGPSELADQRVDLWLAPALLLLVATAMRFAFDHMKQTARKRFGAATRPARTSRVALAASVGLMLLAPVAAHRVLNASNYMNDELDQNFAFALHQVETSDHALMVGPNHNGVVLQFAAFNPNGVHDLYHDPRNMRGLRIELSPPMYTATTLLSDSELIESADRVIMVRLKGTMQSQLRSELESQGFERTVHPRFGLIEVWNRQVPTD